MIYCTLLSNGYLKKVAAFKCWHLTPQDTILPNYDHPILTEIRDKLSSSNI
jgi:hypothetical protein